MASVFQYGIKAAERLATVSRNGLLRAAHFAWLETFSARIRFKASNVSVDAPQGSAVVSAKTAVHLAANLQLDDAGSAWNRYDTGQPGQILLLRSTGGANTIEVYTTPAGANPASLTAAGNFTPEELSLAMAPPRSRVLRSGTQSIPNNAVTAVIFDTTRYNAGGALGLAAMYNAGASTTRLTFQVAGVYDVSAGALWDGVASASRRYLAIVKNGVSELAILELGGGMGNTTRFGGNMATRYFFAANDYVELHAFHNHGSAINIVPSTDGSAFLEAQYRSRV